MAKKITNSLLLEAIADAEAVRETAVANAKLVLEEKITPQIREMIARRLRVEAMKDEDEETEEKEVKKESVGTVVSAESAKEQPFEDAEAVGGSDFPADTSAIATGDNKEPSDDAFDTSAIGDGGENVEDSHTDWYDDWSESDFDLDEVIKELEEDIAAMAAKDDEGEEDEDEEESEAPAPMAQKGEMSKEGYKKHEVSQETPDSDVSKFAKAPVAEEPEMDAGADDEEEIDLEEILAELEAEEDPMGAPAHGGEDKTKEMAAHIAGLKKELAQHRSVINTLRERLQEVNLLNSKLLFTNKIFRKEGLNNEQKVRIVESFDRATTVREVKLVYAALVENLSTAAKTFSTSRKKVVAEGFASKATPSTAPKKQVIVENAVAMRLQELAGIIK
jgi:stress-induced morphogen